PPGHPDSTGGVAVDFGLEDQADIVVGFGGGASGGATIMGLSPGNPNHIAVSMDGEKGGFDWLQEQPNSYVERRLGRKIVRDKDPDRLQPADRWTSSVPGGHPEGYLDAFRNVIAESWRGMKGETKDFPTFGAGLCGIEIVEAAVKSANAGSTAAVTDSGPSFDEAFPFTA
ncbi:MAG: hypothetical protein J0H63_07065, partial [Rhizobiales bacterium]|nr:hypothetical protein [Hyphomicrobiales bacterium]